MIYTITFNPSLDYIMQVPNLREGMVNRSAGEEMYPGGKGINVSIVLRHLGKETVSLGFTAGFTGEKIEALLEECGCQTDFIRLTEGFSRINVKLKGKTETEINGQGPDITGEALDALFHKLSAVREGDALVLAGSIPDTLPKDIYERILERTRDRKLLTVVDATGRLLVNVLKYRPFLVKPNNFELGEIFETDIHTEEELVLCAKKLQRMGARNVLVSRGKDGAVLVSQDGGVYKSLPPTGRAVNSVGAGDSMVAGFLCGYLNTENYEKAFHLGLAAGSASAFKPWLAEREDIIKLLENPKIYGI